MHRVDFQSPIGVLEILSTMEAIYAIHFTERTETDFHLDDNHPAVVHMCVKQLSEYFYGDRMDFTFPYIYEGTDFQQSVWKALTKVPYATTASYKHIAQSIGNDRAVRAVGSANNKNRLPIVIPCHRIISVGGKLTGYAGGLWRKEWLLNHEQAKLKNNPFKIINVKEP